jgi:hypothetical protein
VFIFVRRRVRSGGLIGHSAVLRASLPTYTLAPLVLRYPNGVRRARLLRRWMLGVNPER